MSVDVGGSGSAKSEPNVVPLCDILLVLLIIFMVITPVAQKGIDISLPEQGGSGPSDGRSIVLTIEKDLSMVKLNQIPIGIEMLESKLREHFGPRSDKTIVISADKTVAYKDVLNIIDIARGAGVEVLGVITQAYESQTEGVE